MGKGFDFETCPDGSKIRKEKIKSPLKLELNPADFQLRELTLYRVMQKWNFTHI